MRSGRVAVLPGGGTKVGQIVGLVTGEPSPIAKVEEGVEEG
jgi:hypothetical protein